MSLLTPVYSCNFVTCDWLSLTKIWRMKMFHGWIVSIIHVKWTFHKWNQVSFVNLPFHVWNTLFRTPRFHIWNFQPAHFTYELGISNVKPVPFHMRNENFIFENIPTPNVVHMWNAMWNFRKGCKLSRPPIKIPSSATAAKMSFAWFSGFLWQTAGSQGHLYGLGWKGYLPSCATLAEILLP